MPRPERPIDPEAGVVQRFAAELRRLRQSAESPPYRELARLAHYSPTTLAQAARGEALPTLQVTLAYVRACGGDPVEWEARWRAVSAEIRATPESDSEAKDSDDLVPYLGLAGYGVEDADRFFGRDRLLTLLTERLSRQRFIAVVGASGSGKSSLLRAGLVASTQSESERWSPLLITPGTRPLVGCAVRLAAALHVTPGQLAAEFTQDPANLGLATRQLLATQSSDGDVLLVVDQFEEVFTLCTDLKERDGFITALINAATDDNRTRVVLGLRADFFTHCVRHARLAEVLQDAQVIVGPMNTEELREVVVEPAARKGLMVEKALVSAILEEAAGRPGALPLVSHALWETWRRRRGTSLRLADYRAAGGLAGAIAQSAEAEYSSLTERQQRRTHDIMVRLTALGEGTEDTRRRVSQSELGHDATTTEVLDRLAAARLITVAEDNVEIAHEALITAWPTLREWLTADRELLRAHRRLTDAAIEWDRHGRDEAYLYRGALLATWQDREQDALNEMERTFLVASVTRQDRDTAARRRRLKLTLLGLGATVVVVSLLAVLSLSQAVRAADERELAFSRQMAASARSQLEVDPQLALLLAIKAVETRPTAEADIVLRQAVMDSRIRAIVRADQGEVRGVAFSPDGRRLATGGGDGTVKVWQPSGNGRSWKKPIVLRGHSGTVWSSPAFSPDGSRLATGGVDGTVHVWDLAGRTEPIVLGGHHGPVATVTFDPDGRYLASTDDDGVHVWDLQNRIEPTLLTGHQERANGIAFSPDGRHLASSGYADGTIRVWDRVTWQEVTVLRGKTSSQGQIAYTPDGRHIVSTSTDGVRIWDPSGQQDTAVLRGHAGIVLSLSVAPDGHTIASGSQDGTIRLNNPSSDANALVLRGHRGEVWSVTLSPDSRTLASVGADGTLRLWSTTLPGDPQVLRGHDGPTWCAAFAPDGSHIASGGQDGTIRTWDTIGHQSTVLYGHTDEILDVAYSPNGQQVASTSLDGTTRIWNTTGKDAPLVLTEDEGTTWSVAFSPDGRRVAISTDEAVHLRTIADSTSSDVVLAHGVFRQVAFSPNGRFVAGAGTDGTVRLWRTDGRGAPLVRQGHQGKVFSVRFASNGQHLASGGHDGASRIWPVNNDSEPVILRGHEGLVWSTTFSTDGRYLASSGNDGTVMLWRTIGNTEPIVFHGYRASVETVTFSPQGHRLLTTHDDGTVRIQHCETCGSLDDVVPLAKTRAIRSLTPEENRRFGIEESG